MSYTDIAPREAFQKMEKEGFVYLDVRTGEEFQRGHAKGAVHIPIFVLTPEGRQPNLDFVKQVKEKFPTGTKLVIGCHSGGRSAKACEFLIAEGYEVFNIDGGFGGRIDPSTGQIAQPGWKAENLPCE